VKHPGNWWPGRKRLAVIADTVLSQVPLNHFCADGRRCGQPGQQQGFRLPSFSSSVIRWMLKATTTGDNATENIHLLSGAFKKRKKMDLKQSTTF